jgi:tRNA-specific 2-thiouridylase
MCNSRVKFGCFYDAIEGRGFDYVASGHYAQLVVDDKTGLKKLLRAPDPVKDQSYFLCALTQEQLQKVIFPIGHLQKSEVRELAQEFDLPNKNRPDSQGLCFLGKVKFDEFLGAYLGERPGKILDAATGEQIGRHRGVWYHTVGQRKGIGKVLDPKATSRGPWYVVSKDPSRDIVYASNEYDEDIFTAARTKVFVEDIHWINGAPPAEIVAEDGSFQPTRFQMKIRHGPRIVEGSLGLETADSGSVTLDNKDGGLAPGQFVVFYKEDEPECLGAGIISERHWAKFLSDRIEANATASV